jgi:NTE family protein
MKRQAITLEEWFHQGPFGISLSAGFFGFFAHAGLMGALEDAGLAPEQISGASAGAIIGGGYAAGLRAHDFLKHLENLERADFWDPGLGLGLLKGQKFLNLLREILPINRIENTLLPVGISVFDILNHQTISLRRGCLPRAIAASCCVPGLFRPVWIRGKPYWDGGLMERSGLSGILGEGRVFYHHLQSRSTLRWPLGFFTKRPGMVTFVQQSLPAVGPFKLDQGTRAFEMSYRNTKLALKEPISAALVTI